MWSPTAASLIHGERDAVLVDPLMTVDESRALADWVGATGKNLTTIFVTHAHGDHFYGGSSSRAVHMDEIGGGHRRRLSTRELPLHRVTPVCRTM